MHSRFGTVILIALSMLLAVPVHAGELYLAFLEDHAVELDVGKGRGRREGYEPVVRVAFVKKDGEWGSICPGREFQRVDPGSCPLTAFKAARSWRGYDESANQLEARTLGPAKSAYLSRSGELHTTMPLSRDFGGDRLVVFGGHGFQPSRKPLVLASNEFADSDPELWAEQEVRSDQVSMELQQQLQKHLGSPVQCGQQAPGEDYPVQGQVRFGLSGERLRLRRHYRSATDMELWQVEVLDVATRSCPPFSGDQPGGWAERGSVHVWIYRNGAGQFGTIATPYAATARGALDRYELIAMRDFDGDGRTELVFWYSGYVRDGYVLFSGSFSKMSTFTWGYH